MFSFYNHCIYCQNEIDEKSKTDGEHIIPKSIEGFWRSYDVCTDCKKYFGDNIDGLALKNIDIIEAMKNLGFKEKAPFDGIPLYSKDIVNDTVIPFCSKNGMLRPKVEKSDNYLSCGEDDWEFVAKKWLFDVATPILGKDAAEIEINQIKERYKMLQPGEKLKIDSIRCTIRKGAAKNINVDTNKLPSITPLIAKISIAYLFLVFSGGVADIKELLELRDHCRFNGPIGEQVIYRTRPQEESSYAKYHNIYLESHNKLLMLRITMFGYCCWTVILTSEIPIKIGELNGKLVDASCLKLDFSDPNDKKKFIGFKYSGEKSMLMQRYDI
jgi:hypothetical protein